MRDAYEALRNGPKWNDTLFIITYDEHGGFYDHVSPPQDGVPNPDGWLGIKNGFNYTRLGVRIPTIAISPWIEKGTLVHEPTPEQKPVNTSRFDTTSILATTQKIFGIYEQVLTNRTGWAATFDDLLMTRDTPRTDCISKLPDVPPPKISEHKRIGELPMTNGKRRKVKLNCFFVEPENPDCGLGLKN